MRSQSQRVFYGEEYQGTTTVVPGGVTPWSLSPSSLNSVILSRDDVHKGKVVDGWRYPMPYWAQYNEPHQKFAAVTGKVVQNNGYEVRTSEFSSLVRTYPEFLSINNAPEITNSIRSESYAKLRKKIADGKIELAVAILEGRESLEMLARAFKALAVAIPAVHRRDYAAAANALGVSRATVRTGAKPADAWLAFSFGWKPLIEDIQKAVAILKGGQLANNFKIRAGTKASISRSSDRKYVWEFDAYETFRVRVPVVDTFEGTATLKTSVYLALDNAPYRGLNQLGLLNAPAIAWAVIPYSFVADWVVGIGDVLGGLTADVGLTFISGSETVFRQYTCNTQYGSTSVSNKIGGTLVSKSCDLLPSTGKFARMDRTVLTSLPYPDTLYFKNPLDPWKVVTSSALLRQRLK